MNKFLVWTGIFAMVAVSLVSCTKTDDDEPTGRFYRHRTCVVVPPRADVGLDTFYTQYINCSGIPVVAPDTVPKAALITADSLIAFMLDGLDDVKLKLIENGDYIALYGQGQGVSDLPEWADQPISTSPGGHLPDKHIAVAAMTNVRCYAAPDNRNPEKSILTHEFAHMLHLSGLNNVYPDFDEQVRNAYTQAMDAGLWANTYAALSYTEYFAEGVQIFYGVNAKGGPSGGNGITNDIDTREELQTYDPQLYVLLSVYLNAATDIPIWCLQ